MWLRFLFIFLFISYKGWSVTAFLYKDVHFPPSSDCSQSLQFCTTRTLDTGSLKSSLLQKLKHIFGVEVFVETGTYLGDTTIISANIFPEVHTIELSTELYSQALHRFKDWESVTVHFGDSSQIFQHLLPSIDKRILFYLDGHYSGHVTARGLSDTPLLEELNAIACAKKRDSILLIDDIRGFQTSLFPEKIRSLNLGLETYPTLEKVLQAILNINPQYQICFLGDALLAFPQNLGICLSPVLRSCALHRLEEYCIDLSDKDLEEADHLVSQAKAYEKEEIEIYFKTYSPFELEYGYRSYGAFWQSLILWEQGDEKKAQDLLEKTINLSLPNWSADRWCKKDFS